MKRTSPGCRQPRAKKSADSSETSIGAQISSKGALTSEKGREQKLTEKSDENSTEIVLKHRHTCIN